MPNSLASPNPWLLQIKGRQHARPKIFTGRKKQLHRDVHFLLREWLFLEASSSSDKSQTKMSIGAGKKKDFKNRGDKAPFFADSLDFYTVCFALHCAASISPQFLGLFIFFVSYILVTCSKLRPHKLLKWKLLRIQKSVHSQFLLWTLC